MRGTFFSRQRAGASKLLRDRRGNAMVLTAAALLPMIGIVGSAIDIGRAYMTQLRLQQACDAGVLAGRRAMAGGTYSNDADAEAHKMFNFNFPDNIYGSRAISFSAQALANTADVGGTATAQLPTAIMYIFGMAQFNLSANCVARLEITNTDMMLVLDVTGSMDANTSDGVKRIVAMRDAAKLFFSTMTSATTVGDGRLRFGVVPYSSTVNVGEILRKKNPAWLSDYTLLPSRSPNIPYTWSSGGPAVSTSPTSTSDWTDIFPISGFNGTSSACANLDPPADTAPSSSQTPDMNQTARWVDSSGNPVYTKDTTKVNYYYTYKYELLSGKCWLRRQRVTYTYKTAATKSATKGAISQYRYQDRLFDVSAAKTGGSMNVDIWYDGTAKPVTWGGCIMERRTSAFGSSSAPPSDALDMDVDTPPTSAEETKWRLVLPEISFARAYDPSIKPTLAADTKKTVLGIAKAEGTSKQILTVNSGYVTSETSTNGIWQSYPAYSARGWGVCPAQARNLKTMTAADKGEFDGWIDALQPLGGTYHDIGMLWGIRLLSPIGLFAEENDEKAPGTNKRPIQRHIIFMTDGEMSPSMGDLSAQGYEYLMQRVGGSFDTSAAELKARHNNRFTRLCEIAKDEKHNITIWVIGFGVALNDELKACASTGNGVDGKKAYQTSSSAQLQAIFQSIASQISRLRLSQ